MNDERQLDWKILASFERNEWKSIRNEIGEVAKLRAAAHKLVSEHLSTTQKTATKHASRNSRKRTTA